MISAAKEKLYFNEQSNKFDDFHLFLLFPVRCCQRFALFFYIFLKSNVRYLVRFCNLDLFSWLKVGVFPYFSIVLSSASFHSQISNAFVTILSECLFLFTFPCPFQCSNIFLSSFFVYWYFPLYVSFSFIS